MKKITIFILLLFSSHLFFAQTVHKLLRNGNKLYESEKYEEAAETYHKALEKDPSNIKGKFNLGNATYQNDDYEGAIKQFSAAAEVANDDQVKADAYYNLGNAFFQKAKKEKDQEKFEKSVEAYKNSLRLNPKDVDAKKNLALSQRYIQKMKQQQKQQQQQQQQDQQQDKQQPEEQQQQQQQQQQSQQQQEQQENPQPQEPQASEDLSKEEALELLKIMDEEEKKVQEKLRKARSNGKKPDKDW